MLIKSYSISRTCFQAHCILFLMEFCFIEHKRCIEQSPIWLGLHPQRSLLDSLESNEKYCVSSSKTHCYCWAGISIIFRYFSIVLLATWRSSFAHFIYIQVLATCDGELYYHYVVSIAIVSSRVWTGIQFNSTCMLGISSTASDHLQDFKLNFVSCIVSADILVLTSMLYLPVTWLSLEQLNQDCGEPQDAWRHLNVHMLKWILFWKTNCLESDILVCNLNELFSVL